jgi:hypothetical protein
MYNQNKTPQGMLEEFCFKIQLGDELFLRGATPQLSWPQQRLTTEFGKGSEWFHYAIDTKQVWV